MRKTMIAIPEARIRFPEKGRARAIPEKPRTVRIPTPQLAHPETRNPGRKAPKSIAPERDLVLKLR